jgi:hypothetical protein
MMEWKVAVFSGVLGVLVLYSGKSSIDWSAVTHSRRWSLKNKRCAAAVG